jgi:hypothetical protein
MRAKFMDVVHETVKPYLADKGYNWGVNSEELEREFVHIPLIGSEDEQRWFRDNEPSPWGPYIAV